MYKKRDGEKLKPFLNTMCNCTVAQLRNCKQAQPQRIV